MNLRLKGRFVPRQTILDAIDSYEIVESYPGDKHLPSYLVLARLPCPEIRFTCCLRPTSKEIM